MNDRVVSQKARFIARDEARARDLSDAEWECLEDLLKRDEAFGQIVTAQRAGVSLNEDDYRIDEQTADLAHEAADRLADARERVVEQRVEESKEIVALARLVDRPAPWGVMIDVYLAGFQTAEELREADLHELVAEAGIAPAIAERIRAAVNDPKEVP